MRDIINKKIIREKMIMMRTKTMMMNLINLQIKRYQYMIC